MYEIQVPGDLFPGFYNTLLDLDNFEFEEYELDYEKFNFDLYKQNIVHRIINILENKLGIEIIKYELDSPSSYNYRNDELYIYLELEAEQILKLCFESEFRNDILYDFISEDHNDNNYISDLFSKLIYYECYIEEEDLFEIVTECIFNSMNDE